MGPTSELLPESSPMLSVRDVGKSYVVKDGGELAAVADISFELSNGEFCCVLGPSGCGKTTLMKMIAGLLTTSSGSIEVSGRPVGDSAGNIGVVYQQPVLYPWRTVLRNVAIPGEILRLDRQQSLKRSQELLDLVGLSGFERRYPKQLSGGMQQRASLARALVHDPDFLLMDEPFGALDAITREHLQTELLRIWSSLHKTVLFITHSIPEAVLLSDKVLVMSSRPGRVVESMRIDLPRPRTLEMINTSAFGHYVHIARTALDEQVTHEGQPQ